MKKKIYISPDIYIVYVDATLMDPGGLNGSVTDEQWAREYNRGIWDDFEEEEELQLYDKNKFDIWEEDTDDEE